MKNMNIFSKNFRGWQGVSYILLLSLLLLSYTSCSEDDSATDEYANWQERNEAVTTQWAASGMKKIRVYTQNETPAGKSSDYIYVEELERGNGTESPLFTDTVYVAYRGRFIPTTDHPDGYVFDQTFINDFTWQTANASKGQTAGFVTGFTTALMNMHVGDRWRVHIPYQLGYGAAGQKTIRGYTNLVFEIALYDYWSLGETRPAFRAREKE